MVAPQQDFPIWPGRRNLRALFAPAEPPQGAGALLHERRSLLAFRAAAALLFGLAFMWPDLPETMVVRLFAGYALVDGIIALAPGGWGPLHRLGWPLLIGGCIDIAGTGAVYLSLPSGMTMLLLGNIAMVWAIASGVALTVACATLRESDTDHLLLAGGIASLVLGRALLSQLAIDPVVLSTWLGLYALTMAVLFLKLTLKHYRLMLL
jgi:uncharacterized membrane protein HdeD (DUF308 family)